VADVYVASVECIETWVAEEVRVVSVKVVEEDGFQWLFCVDQVHAGEGWNASSVPWARDIVRGVFSGEPQFYHAALRHTLGEGPA